VDSCSFDYAQDRFRRNDPPPHCVLWRAGKVSRRSFDKLRTGPATAKRNAGGESGKFRLTKGGRRFDLLFTIDDGSTLLTTGLLFGIRFLLE
jgi:hypothetical protein